MDVEGVFGDVLGIIFAPDRFYTKDLRDCKKGLLPLVRMRSLFRNNTDMVITILKELRLGVMISNDVIQVPALLRDFDERISFWDDQKEYAQYAGWRFKLKDETNIFSPSSFPKLQVQFLEDKKERVQVWTQGLCFTEESVQILVYMDKVKQSVYILVRSKQMNEKSCYLLRKRVREQIKDVFGECSAGTDYQELILRPGDLKSIKNDFTGYDYKEVLGAHEEKQAMICADGWRTDSIQELLFCNYFEIGERRCNT